MVKNRGILFRNGVWITRDVMSINLHTRSIRGHRTWAQRVASDPNPFNRNKVTNIVFSSHEIYHCILFHALGWCHDPKHSRLLQTTDYITNENKIRSMMGWVMRAKWVRLKGCRLAGSQHSQTNTHTSSEVSTAGCSHVIQISALSLLRPPSGAQRELVLFYRLFHPSPQSCFLEGLDERLLGGVILHCCLLGFVVWARFGHFDPEGGRELRRESGTCVIKWWWNLNLSMLCDLDCSEPLTRWVELDWSSYSGQNSLKNFFLIIIIKKKQLLSGIIRKASALPFEDHEFELWWCHSQESQTGCAVWGEGRVAYSLSPVNHINTSQCRRA